MVQSAINVPAHLKKNRILSKVSLVRSTDMWKTTTEDVIKDSIASLFGTHNELYGVELHAFWLGAISFTNLEDYFAGAYVDSPGASTAYSQSQSDLISLNFQISALNSSIHSLIKQRMLNAADAQLTSYFANTDLTNLVKLYTSNQTNMTPISTSRFFAVSTR